MAISRRPKSKMPSNAVIDAVISKGGSTPTEKSASKSSSSQKKEAQNILLQLPISMLEQIDKIVSESFLYSNRSQWIREALVEKLEKTHM